MECIKTEPVPWRESESRAFQEAIAGPPSNAHCNGTWTVLTGHGEDLEFTPEQSFSSLNVLQNPPGAHWNKDGCPAPEFLTQGVWVGHEICTRNKFPQEANAAGLGATLLRSTALDPSFEAQELFQVKQK